ncbi:GATOR complex protein NPRL2-like isoform X2 [Physella acuta]|uniref:GATOR complex protein NPRL2-like isoform X2 n=1 Tax=Physella acuta TaxID=109671 RepID=UPI0027DCD9F3|nr:GATOR complex protein NPRL2-like isoform X2 [Physella acuta]
MSTAKAIRCIFLSEFHHTQGPIITHQTPEEYISKEIFDAIQNFVITKPEFQNRLITKTAFGHKFVGCPKYIDNDKYKRNAFIFNICFVVAPESLTSVYGSVVKKLSAYLTQLENELGFLSKPENSTQVSQFLKKVLDGLNNEGCCNIKMAKSCTVHLKLAATIQDPIPVEDHDVPIFIVPRDIMMKYQWDLTTQQILHYVDGMSHVLKIAAEADVELNLVKASLQNLLHYKFMTLVPIFQYCNKYVTAPDIQKLVEDVRLQEECVRFVAKSDRSPPEFRDVFGLYSAFSNAVTVKHLCLRQKNPHVFRVDERKLVQFGMMKALIRRVHEYPIALPGEPLTAALQPLHKYLDGRYTMDQICCQTGLSHEELHELFERDDCIMVIHK